MKKRISNTKLIEAATVTNADLVAKATAVTDALMRAGKLQSDRLNEQLDRLMHSQFLSTIKDQISDIADRLGAAVDLDEDGQSVTLTIPVHDRVVMLKKPFKKSDGSIVDRVTLAPFGVTRTADTLRYEGLHNDARTVFGDDAFGDAPPVHPMCKTGLSWDEISGNDFVPAEQAIDILPEQLELGDRVVLDGGSIGRVLAIEHIFTLKIYSFKLTLEISGSRQILDLRSDNLISVLR